MTLIAALVSLAVELFSSDLEKRRTLHWFADYAEWLRHRFGESAFWNGPAGILVILLLPLLVVGFLQHALWEFWFGLLALIFSIGVLLYSLRYQPVDKLVDDYVDASDAGDRDRARKVAGQILGGSLPEGAGSRPVVDAVLVQANERLFAVLFWFVILGPVGAVLYRLTWLLANPLHSGLLDQSTPDLDDDSAGFVEAAQRLCGILEWIPARLVAVSYALTGSFEDAIHEWRNAYERSSGDFVQTNDAILCGTGVGALHIDRYTVQAEDVEEAAALVEASAVKAAQGLVLRTLVVWVSVIALMTLAGWAS
jgi:AmpE protein